MVLQVMHYFAVPVNEYNLMYFFSFVDFSCVWHLYVCVCVCIFYVCKQGAI